MMPEIYFRLQSANEFLVEFYRPPTENDLELIQNLLKLVKEHTKQALKEGS